MPLPSSRTLLIIAGVLVAGAGIYLYLSSRGKASNSDPMGTEIGRLDLTYHPGTRAGPATTRSLYGKKISSSVWQYWSVAPDLKPVRLANTHLATGDIVTIKTDGSAGKWRVTLS